jgi:ribosome-associated protein
MALGELIAEPAVRVPGWALRWRAVRSSGPGGQNVNKVASKVELRVALACITGLNARTGARLRALAGARLTLGEEIVVTSTLTRDQARNLDDAVTKLQGLLVRAQALPRARRATVPSKGAVRRRLSDKKLAGAKKKGRRVDSDEG